MTNLFYPRPLHLPAVPKALTAAGLEAVGSIATPESLRELAGESLEPKFFDSQGKLNLLLPDPVDVHDVLAKKSSAFIKGDFEQEFSRAFGWGVLGDEGEHLKTNQSSLSPAFHSTALESYRLRTEVLAAEHLEALVGGEASLLTVARRFTQEAIECAFLPWSKGPIDYSYGEALLSASEIYMSGRMADKDSSIALPAIRAFQVSKKKIEAYIDQAVSEYVESHNRTASILDMFLEVDPESDLSTFSPVHQQLSALFQEAMETTAALISWAIILLDEQPEYWQQLQGEMTISGPTDHYRQLRDLALHDAVIREALRLYPPVWAIPRIVHSEVEIGNHRLMPGTRVTLSPFVTHRMPQIFNSPQVFRPERWADASLSLSPGAFFPFGLGKRICMGQRFGTMTALVFLKKISELRLKVQLRNPDRGLGPASFSLAPKSTVRLHLL